MKPKHIALSFAIALSAAALAAQAPQQPQDLATTITGGSGGLPRIALPAFLALSPDAETVAAAKTITDVLWDDLNYEHEFSFVERDVNSTIPPARTVDDPPFDRWREVNADGLIAGSVQKSGTGSSSATGCSTSRAAARCSAPSTAGRPTRAATRTRLPTRFS
jgi:hypothetical protein